MHLAPNAVFSGRCRLIRELGRAEHGPVWLAHHFRLGLPCVIKLIDPESCHPLDAWARLEAEIETNRLLRCEHVAEIYERGIWDSVPYVMIEYLDGESLRARLARVGRLDIATTCRIVEHVANALATLHAEGIVHGELQPDDVFLTHRRGGEQAKLINFGADLARYEWSVRAPSARIDRVPYYASPEQLRGFAHIDHRTDIWSLGLIAYHCLTGTRPFHTEDPDDIVAEIAFESLFPPSRLAPDLPRGVDAWWRYAMAREPNERFQTSKQLAEALVSALPTVETDVVPVPALVAGQSPHIDGLSVAVGQPRTASATVSVSTGWDPDASDSSAPVAIDTLLSAVGQRGEMYIVRDEVTSDPKAVREFARIRSVLQMGLVAALFLGAGVLGALVRHRLGHGGERSKDIETVAAQTTADRRLVAVAGRVEPSHAPESQLAESPPEEVPAQESRPPVTSSVGTIGNVRALGAAAISQVAPRRRAPKAPRGSASHGWAGTSAIDPDTNLNRTPGSPAVDFGF